MNAHPHYTLEEARALAEWLKDRNAGYPWNPAMDVWPSSNHAWSVHDGATWKRDWPPLTIS